MDFIRSVDARRILYHCDAEVLTDHDSSDVMVHVNLVSMVETYVKYTNIAEEFRK